MGKSGKKGRGGERRQTEREGRQREMKRYL